LIKSTETVIQGGHTRREEEGMATSTETRRGGEQDDLASYLKAIRLYAPLGRDEEHDLAVRARAGDKAAARELVRHNLAFVVAIARRQRRGSVRLEDIIQEGNLGLLRAVEKFDPHAGTRFSTYAVWWIRAYVGKHLKEARSSVRPLSGTVAQADFSLDTAVDEDGEATHLERIEDPGPGPEETCASSEDGRRVRRSLSRLRKRIGEVGWDVVHSRLERDEPVTLDEIGRRWGISRERVRQIELRTKETLRRALVVETEREAA
jgi:RNA polymerase primary sigma factor